jgi:glycine cleavage system aminomethyltransferase T
MTTAIAYSPLQAWQNAQGASFADYGPWRLASVYSSVATEQTVARNGLALADLSAMGKISLEGHGVDDLVRSWSGEARPGQIVPLANDTWACVSSKDRCLLLSAQPAGVTHMHDVGGRLSGFRSELAYDMTSGQACLGLFGPEHGIILRQLSSLDIGTAGLPVKSCAQTGFAGVPALLVAMPGSCASTWILIAWDLAEYVWERIWQIGHPLGMLPLGMEAYLSGRSNL